MNHLGRMLLLGVVIAILGTATWVCLTWTIGSPEPDLWRRALGLDSLWLSWSQAEARSEGPARLVFRGVYAWLLNQQLPYDSLGWLTLGSALLAFLLLARWIHTCIAGRLGPTTRTAILLALCAAMFSPSFGANWLLVERFRMFVPIACLAAGGLLLRPGRWQPLRFMAALLIAQLALLTEVRGHWVWIALLPCCAAIDNGPRRTAYLAGWIIAGNAGALACEFNMGTAAPSEASWIVTAIFAAPWNYLLDVVATLGRSLPDLLHGTTSDESTIGAAMLLIFVVTSTLAWRRRGVTTAAWSAMAIFGLGAALTSAAQTQSLDIDRIARHELEWSVLALPIGLGGLLAEIGGDRSRQWLRALLPAILVLQAQDWQRGFTDLSWRHCQLRAYEARLALYGVAGLEPEKIGPSPFAADFHLKDAQRRRLLAIPEPFDDLHSRLQAAAAAQPLPTSGEVLDAYGETVSGSAADLAALIWIAQDSKDHGWQLLQATPLQRNDADNLYSWVVNLDEASVPADASRLAAFAFDLDHRDFVRLAGNVQVKNRSFAKEQPQ